ncbi:MAG: hypothetical protein ABIT01_06150 [Thermoanaerobaculia bacterium]
MRRGTGAFLCALSFGLLSGCTRVNETRFLNFDAESTTGALGAGWSGFEKTDQNDTFAWCQGKLGRVSFQCRSGGDRLVRFRCWPFQFPGGGAQSATLFVNDARLESVPLQGDVRVYSVLAPAAVFKNGANEMRFEFTYAETPKDRVPGSTDERTLAAAFDWIEILPTLPPATRRS